MQDSQTSSAVSSMQATAKQNRSLRTRQELLDAAREVFSRDGFDSTRLQDIAALAGKTRGAFYAHFKDKEDVFFAIFEQDIERDQQQFALDLGEASSMEERADACVQHLWNVLQDHRRMLLHLEFKMYALRQATRTKRLADLHAAMCMAEPGDGWDLLLPELCSGDAAYQRRTSARFSAILDGLALTMMFDRGTLDEKTIRRQLRCAIRSIMADSTSQ